MKIILNENKIHLIEEIVYLGEKEKVVLDWLNKHFKIITTQDTDELSLPKLKKSICVLDAYGQPTERLKKIDDVFYILQTNFKKILSDKKDRDKFLINTLRKWSS